MTADDILTLQEAGRLAKVQPSTVRTWLQHRKLPGLKAGKEWRVRREDLEAFMQQAVEVPLRLVRQEAAPAMASEGE